MSVPTNSILTIHKQTVLLHPILDEFYDDDPNMDRSSCYAVSQGQSAAQGTAVPSQSAAAACTPPEPDSADTNEHINGSRLHELSHKMTQIQLQT